MIDTALIIVDMQNAFCTKNGSFWKRGRKVLNFKKVLSTNKKLISFARRKKWLVIFTKLVFTKDYSDGGLLVKRNSKIAELGAFQEGSADSEITKSLKPEKNEYVITKKRHDPFIGTNLLQILRENNIRRVIVSGVVTNICVESTIRSAFDRDLETILVKDGTSASSHKLYKSSLETINKSFGDVMSLEELFLKFEN
ncbi:hypothetical protein COU00_01210 [Candidatus Falkowbacteria bacterium CG10_big_fil_rev_8_21_14_0_10_43_11]|uniref:Isochorismatase-like domain-containing protein n=1 Tax=Candidatus Falkowbacteria bacterium CG10_big_fil_rev_8_21_14_0_10_43_11 TaxID=1974568 RepID=A0A2M6WMK7_9BACT|nr:MAG: hypothetical protein COU00_01210 [Candidatus Falkowbacteria bacterium CG10_big_fil_rev_8_21_14_0_10_43_11]